MTPMTRPEILTVLAEMRGWELYFIGSEPWMSPGGEAVWTRWNPTTDLNQCRECELALPEDVAEQYAAYIEALCPIGMTLVLYCFRLDALARCEYMVLAIRGEA